MCCHDAALQNMTDSKRNLVMVMMIMKHNRNASHWKGYSFSSAEVI
jgi:hypothetical protein